MGVMRPTESEKSMSRTDPSTLQRINDLPEGTAGGNDSSEVEVNKDDIFEILKNSRRRGVLRYIEERCGEESVSLSDVAEHIAAKENDVTVAMLSSKQRKRVYVGLYQCHLPKMDEAGVIDFNKARGTIELRESASVLYPYLYLDEEADASEESGESEHTAISDSEDPTDSTNDRGTTNGETGITEPLTTLTGRIFPR